MAIRRNKLDRKADLTLDNGRVIDMPPGWAFTIDCPHHGKIPLDFNPYRKNGREDLAGHVRDAFWSQRHECVGLTLRLREAQMRTFWRFLEDLAAAGEFITRLDQIDRKLLDRYLAWLEMQVTTIGKTKGQRLAIAARKVLFSALKTTLTNRQKRVPHAVSPHLDFPRNPFPNSNQLSRKREGYSTTEQDRLAKALNADLRAIHEDDDPLPPLQVLVVHLVILGITTGRNLQALLDLRRDSLREHPLKDRELLVTQKRRGWSTHATSVRKSAAAPETATQINSIPASVGEHFRFLCAYSAPLVDETGSGNRDFLFLWRLTRGEHKGRVVRLDYRNANNGIQAFIKRHGLLNDRGQPFALNIARLRPTFANSLYRRSGDIRRVQQALGHSSVQTTARHYVETPLESERDHSFVLDSMVCQFVRQEVEGKVLVAADGQIPLQEMKNLLSGGYNTGIARCKNPFRGDESVCKKFFACFKCPSMCVFEDDLWRLFSFYYRLLAERRKLSAGHWEKTFAPIIRRIDTDIASQFSKSSVAAARSKAQDSPHPAWKGPLL